MTPPICFLSRKLVKKVTKWKRCVYLDFVESNLFMKCFDFLFSSPIPHSAYILKFACILLNVCITSWLTFGASSHHPHPMHNKHLFTHVPWIPQKTLKIIISTLCQKCHSMIGPCQLYYSLMPFVIDLDLSFMSFLVIYPLVII